MSYLDKLRARLAEVREELRALAEVDAEHLTEEQETRFSELETILEETHDVREDATRGLLAEIEREEHREDVRSRVDEVAERGGRATEGPNDGVVRRVNTGQRRDPFDVSDLRFDTPGSELRARAESAVESAVGDLEDGHRERAIELLRRSDDVRGTLAKRILATGSPAYRSAFQKVAAGHGNLLSSDEQAALVRAASLTDSAGGYAIPFTLDPTIIMTNDGAANPFRQVSRIESIVTDTWNGVSSAGVTGGYAAEASEVGDDAPTLAQPSVAVERWDVFVPFSFEVGQDWANLEGDVRMMVAEKRDEFDLAAFTTGSGSDEPTGIITALDGTASEVAPATAETFAVADVYAVEAALPPKYRRTAEQAQWMAALGTAQTIRQFDSSGGADLWERIGAGTPARLLGYPFRENSEMDAAGDIDDTATADNFILILGDWRNYLIVDRVGMNMELVPHIMGANNRPSGQRGFLAWGRTGAGSLNDNAFRVLSIPTEA